MTDKIWYLAICEDCRPRLPQPFSKAEERAEWVRIHIESTNHRVTMEQEKGNG